MGNKMNKVKVYCDKCKGKGHWYDYGHEGETEYYHECKKCHSTGYLFITEHESNENNRWVEYYDEESRDITQIMDKEE